MSPLKPIPFSVFLSLAVAAAAAPALAATYTWTGASTVDANVWTDPTNWTGPVPLPNDGTADLVTANGATNGLGWNINGNLNVHSFSLGTWGDNQWWDENRYWNQNGADSITLSGGGTCTISNGALVNFCTSLTLNGNTTINSNNYMFTLSDGWSGNARGNIYGTGSLTVTGTGAVRLCSPNSTFTGGMTITSGLVLMEADQSLDSTGHLTSSSLGLGAVTLNGGQIGGNSGTGGDYWNPWNQTNRTIYNAMNLDHGTLQRWNSNTLTLAGPNQLINNNSVLTINGSIVISGALGQDTPGRGVTFQPDTTQSGWSVTLAGASSYTGSTQIAASLPVALGTTGTLAPASVFTVNGSLTISDASVAQTIGGLAGTGSVSLGSVSLTINQASNTSFSGAITGSTLTKTGAGSLTLTGTSNSITGAATVSGGRLILSGTGATTGGPVNVNATLVLDNGSSLSSVVANVIAARNGGAWDHLNGPLASSRSAADYAANAGNEFTGLAVVQNSSLPTPLAGYSLNAILVKYTYVGDTNLDGTLTADDYLALDDGYLFGMADYVHGDLNYDGVVNAADFALLDNAYLHQSGPLAAEPMIALHESWFGASYLANFAGLAPVPEPASLALLAVGMLPLLSRRRRL